MSFRLGGQSKAEASTRKIKRYNQKNLMRYAYNNGKDMPATHPKENKRKCIKIKCEFVAQSSNRNKSSFVLVYENVIILSSVEYSEIIGYPLNEYTSIRGVRNFGPNLALIIEFTHCCFSPHYTHHFFC